MENSNREKPMGAFKNLIIGLQDDADRMIDYLNQANAINDKLQEQCWPDGPDAEWAPSQEVIVCTVDPATESPSGR